MRPRASSLRRAGRVVQSSRAPGGDPRRRESIRGAANPESSESLRPSNEPASTISPSRGLRARGDPTSGEPRTLTSGAGIWRARRSDVDPPSIRTRPGPRLTHRAGATVEVCRAFYVDDAPVRGLGLVVRRSCGSANRGRATWARGRTKATADVATRTNATAGLRIILRRAMACRLGLVNSRRDPPTKGR